MAKETTVNLTVSTVRVFIIKIKGLGALLSNKIPDMSKPKTEGEAQEKVDRAELERLTWREKLYFDKDGLVYLPGENFHQCLKDGAMYWKQKIPGEGNATYTNVVDKSLVIENAYFGLNKDDDAIIPFGKMCNGNPSKGKKSGCKVYKIRPMIMPWELTFKAHVFDARITVQILKTVVSYAGTFSGLGDWRPTYGRFELVSVEEV